MPRQAGSYNISLGEMGQMSRQARYYQAGFLAVNQPGPPRRQAPTPTQGGDLTAWKAATTIFRRTGFWLGRWHTCQTCGRVLLPASVAEDCQEHLPDTDIPAP